MLNGLSTSFCVRAVFVSSDRAYLPALHTEFFNEKDPAADQPKNSVCFVIGNNTAATMNALRLSTRLAPRAMGLARNAKSNTSFSEYDERD